MNYLLYLDTSDKQSRLMLMNGQSVLSCRSNDVQMNHGQVINSQISEMMNEASVTWEQIDGLCVLNGPGSYTGLRIALSAAKGICYAKDIPLILINKLDLLYHCIDHKIKDQAIFVIIKAREDEYFSAFYPSSNSQADFFSLQTKVELLSEIKKHNAVLAFENTEYRSDFTTFTQIKVENTDIFQLCIHYFIEEKFSDLLHSEPFYLKNVYINKINKL